MMNIFNWLFTETTPFVTTYCAIGVDSLIQYNNNIIDNLFVNSAVLAFFKITLFIGGVLYVAGIGFAFANFTVENKEDAGAQIIDTIKNIFIGFAAFSAYTTIPVLLLKFTNYICDLMCSNFAAFTMLSQVESLMNGNTDVGDVLGRIFESNSLFIMIYAIIMFVCVCKVFFSNIKRGGVLITLIFVCSFHLFSIPRGYTDAFWSWCKQVAGVCITAFVQNFLITLALLIVSASGTANSTSLIVSVGVALSASEVPRILQQFGLDTSMRANISQAIFAASGVTSIVRAFV